MATITTRSGKGSPLTNTELDSNFTNLNSDKLESSSYTASDVLTKIKTVDGAGSGLDADTLDGNQATAFATAAQGTLADSAVQPSDNISGLTNDSGYITGNQTITLSGDVSGSGTTSITATVANDSHSHTGSTLSGIAVSNLAGSAVQTSAEGFSDSDTVLMTAAAVADKIESYGYSTSTGDITGVTAGSGLTGGGTSGSVTVSHADTSSQGSVNNSGATVVQDVTLDTYGHVTGLASKTMTLADLGYTGETNATADQTASEILTAIKTVDGSGSGLDADKLDGQQGSYYYPASNPNGYTTNVGDITGVTAGTNLTGGGTSGTVTLNVSSTPSFTSATFGSGVTLQESTDRADLLQITSSTSGWAGLQIRNSSNEGRWSFMTDGSTAGIFDDENNDWITQHDENGETRIYYNSLEKFNTNSSGCTVTGNLSVTGTVDGRDVASDGSKLDGIESGATADQSASEILTAIKTVDGSGSGLDADTLDGIQGANLLRSDTSDTMSGTLNVTGSLAVGSSSTPSQRLHLTNSSSTGYATTRITTNARSFDIGMGGSTASFNPNNFYLYDVTASAERMVIDTSGNVSFGSGKIAGKNLPSGSVIQTKWNNFTGGTTGSGASSVVWLGTNFRYNITPQYSDSKILLMVSIGLNLICDGRIHLRRSTNGGSSWTTINTQWFGATRYDNQHDYEYSSGMQLDSPATTNNVLYELGVTATGCGGVYRIGAADNNWTWTLMEIAA